MHRRSYADDPGLGDRVFRLLGAVWPGLPLDAARRRAERFGASWEGASTPFVREERGKVVSHVGLLPLPLYLGGRLAAVGGVHGVATHPAHRRRGMFRSLMEELLRHAESRYEALALTTAHPAYFAPFGFRVVPESAFALQVERSSARIPSRPLDPESESDRTTAHRLLGGRRPLSEVLSVGPERAVWAFAELAAPPRYAPDLDAIVCGETRGTALALFDVVAERLPTLDRVVASWPDPVEEVLAFFTPDLLAPGFRPEAHRLAGGPRAMDAGGDNTVLMARGPFLPDGARAMLGRPGRC